MKVLRGEGFAPRFMQRLIAVKCNPFHIIDIITQKLLSLLTAGLHALNWIGQDDSKNEKAQFDAGFMRLATFSLVLKSSAMSSIFFNLSFRQTIGGHRNTNYTGTPGLVARPSSEMSGTLLICFRNIVHYYFQNDCGEWFQTRPLHVGGVNVLVSLIARTISWN